MGEVPVPNDSWIRLLSDHGIAILIVMFVLFVVLPFCAFNSVNGIKWIGAVLKEFFDRIAATAEQSAKTQEEIKSLVVNSGLVDNRWHEEKVRKLDEINNGVKSLHGKVDGIAEHVNKK